MPPRGIPPGHIYEAKEIAAAERLADQFETVSTDNREAAQTIRALIQVARDSQNKIMNLQPPAFVVPKILLNGTAPAARKPAAGELLAAVEANDVKLVEALLARGADANEKDNMNVTPLMSAAFEGYLAIVRSLIEAGANIEAKSSHGRTALDFAREYRNYHTSEEIITLLKAAIPKKPVTTALSEAVLRNDTNLVQALLNEGANVNEANTLSNTPLLNAAKVGNVKVIKSLIHAGADVEARNVSGNTALDIAKLFNNLDVVKLLTDVAAGVQLEADQQVKTAAMKPAAGELLKAVENRELHLVKALLRAGADANETNNYGTTPLIKAAEKADIAIAYTLIEAGADITAKNRNGTTALKRAQANSHKGIARILSDLADPGKPKQYYMTIAP